MTYHAIKEGVELGSIKPYYKKSNLNIADLFTKNVVAGTVKSLLDVLCGYKLVLFEPEWGRDTYFHFPLLIPP